MGKYFQDKGGEILTGYKEMGFYNKGTKALEHDAQTCDECSVSEDI